MLSKSRPTGTTRSPEYIGYYQHDSLQHDRSAHPPHRIASAWSVLVVVVVVVVVVVLVVVVVVVREPMRCLSFSSFSLSTTS